MQSYNTKYRSLDLNSLVGILWRFQSEHKSYLSLLYLFIHMADRIYEGGFYTNTVPRLSRLRLVTDYALATDVTRRARLYSGC